MSISRYRLLALGLVIALLAGTAVAAGTGALPGKLGDLVGQRQGSQSGAGSTAAAASGAGAPSASGATSAGGGAAAGGAGGATSAGGAGSLVAGVAGVVAPQPVAPPPVRARAALLADEATGQVLYQRRAGEPRAMASTTKVMTALLALERLSPNRTVVIGAEPPAIGEESLRLRQGERFTVRQLLLGLLVKSANDAAVALADAVDGSEAAFVRRMNRRAAELHLTSTHYVTAYGLDRPGHRTSARDLAHLWEVAMRRADFRALVTTREARLPGSPARLRHFVNTNLLLGSYAWVVGGKTGFTDDAGRCLVASASRGGRRLVAVALGSPDAIADVRALFEYGFTQFNWVRLAERGELVPPPGGDGAGRSFQVRADVDALVRSDLLGKVTLGWPSGGQASTAGAVTAWLQAGGMRLAPLPLAALPAAPAAAEQGARAPDLAPEPVPPDARPAAIDPLLRRAAA